MTYIMSDLHGCYDLFLWMAEKIHFTEKDRLYLLGDLVDRGKSGMALLLDIMERPNVVPLCGNHDFVAMMMLKSFSTENIDETPYRLVEPFVSWLCDGGLATYQDFLRLEEKKQKKVLNYMSRFLTSKEIQVNGQKYLLCHSVPSKKEMMEQLKQIRNSTRTSENGHHENDKKAKMTVDYFSGGTEYDQVYFPDKIIVTGHLPTEFIDPRSKGRIWKGNQHIAVDCGAVFGESLGCICLETGEEFYVDCVKESQMKASKS